MKYQRIASALGLMLVGVTICFAQQEQKGTPSEEQSYLVSRKEREDAQAAYYAAQTAKLSQRSWISAEWQAVLTALFGAVLGYLGSMITTKRANAFQLQLEGKKAALTRRETLDQELRSQVAEAGRGMLSAQHSMEWVCWYADQAPKLLDKEIVTAYQKEIHVTFPKLLGDLAGVASLNQQIYESLASLASSVYSLDGKIAGALARFKKTPDESLKILQECYPETTRLYQELPISLARIMKAPEG
jgi:hypothetical protein